MHYNTYTNLNVIVNTWKMQLELSWSAHFSMPTYSPTLWYDTSISKFNHFFKYYVSRPTNALNINFFLLPTKFLQPVNLAILTIWSLFNPLLQCYSFLPTYHLLIENYRSLIQICITRLWNQLPDSFRQPRQSCLDSPRVVTTYLPEPLEDMAVWTDTDLILRLHFISFLSASLYFSKRGAYWDRLCRDVVGCHARALWPNGTS